MKQMLFVVLLVSGLLLGCAVSSPPEPESPLETPTQFDSPLHDSPLSPTAAPSSALDGPAFEIEEPLVPGAVQVRGKGPYNIPIVIVDVTLAAKPLGSGVIGPDGTFVIDLSEELIVNRRIGIMAGMTEGATPVPSTDAYIESLKPFRGDGYKNLPSIGIIFASAMVIEASP